MEESSSNQPAVQSEVASFLDSMPGGGEVDYEDGNADGGEKNAPVVGGDTEVPGEVDQNPEGGTAMLVEPKGENGDGGGHAEADDENNVAEGQPEVGGETVEANATSIGEATADQVMTEVSHPSAIPLPASAAGGLVQGGDGTTPQVATPLPTDAHPPSAPMLPVLSDPSTAVTPQLTQTQSDGGILADDEASQTQPMVATDSINGVNLNGNGDITMGEEETSSSTTLAPNQSSTEGESSAVPVSPAKAAGALEAFQRRQQSPKILSGSSLPNSPHPTSFTPQSPTSVRNSANSTPVPGNSSTSQTSNAIATATPIQQRKIPPPPIIPAPNVPLTKVAQLRKRIERDRLDGDAWLGLIDEIVKKGDLERVREVMEGFLAVWPMAHKQWIQYASIELSHSNFAQVETIFTRSLRSSPFVDLWKFYLTYIRRVNPVNTTTTLPGKAGEEAAKQKEKEARAIIGRAFEYSLGYVGMDRESGAMWMEYLGFLKEAGGQSQSWEDQQRMDLLRRTYQRAVCIPLNNVEQIWREYNNFEQGISKMTAKKFLSERSQLYQTARAALKVMRNLSDDLPMPDIPCPPVWSLQASAVPLPLVTTGGVSNIVAFEDEEKENKKNEEAQERKDRENLEKWKSYLKWEEGNPLVIDDLAARNARVMFAYKKATIAMRYYPEIWHMAALYAASMDKQDEVGALLRAGLEANPRSCLLAFSYVDLLESRKQHNEANQVFESLLNAQHAHIDQLTQNMETEIANATHSDDITSSEKEDIRLAITKKRTAGIEKVKAAASTVWIAHMHMAMRSEGVKPARAVFGKARKSPHLTWHVYEASALMEFHWNKDIKVAINIFEHGLKFFGDDVDYAVRYLEFLLWINDNSNARALFEKTVARVTDPAKARPMWERWARYEYQYGDHLAIKKLDERLAGIYPNENPLERFRRRFTYPRLNDFLVLDMGSEAVRSTSGSRSRSRSKSPYSRSRSPSPPPHIVNGRKRGKPDDDFGPIGRRGSPPLDGYREGQGGSSRRSEFKRLKADPADRESLSPPPQPPARGPPPRGGPPHRMDDHEGGPPPTSGRGGPRHSGPGGRGGAPSGGLSRRDFSPTRRDQPPRRGGGFSGGYREDDRDEGSREPPYPEAIKFFVSILPPAASFTGPVLNAATVVEVIHSTNLPTTMPSQPPGQSGPQAGAPGWGGPPHGRRSPPPRSGTPPLRRSRNRSPDYGDYRGPSGPPPRRGRSSRGGY